MSMTNDELRQAIEDANKRISTTSSGAAWFGDLVEHLLALMAEQQRRAVAQQAYEPSPTVWPTPAPVPAVSPYPQFVPGPAISPIGPPWTVTCVGKAL